ncbi:hypothetical protein J31TS4_18480 [Paenibacillus sp. J31TS4]|uniref:DUF2087 domain-containing protein n=1 Tax=Paenibacillus sp. J31TS4 TaxID=2807195 RepID=UPI001B082F2C|nr:metalloregulator ArsR/SmtB family transcription factor [Paenibacillus sp. J31TS4]GIP38568.1 hypothetical protein J31TS4_18480 [Paenibacillus sp. J31TS4]
MQLEKIVAFHKALADPTRIRMLVLLAVGEKNGQELAGQLNLSQPTVTHHAAKLREAALIGERREKNTVWFSLDRTFLAQNAQAIVDLVARTAAKEGGREMATETEETRSEKLRASVLRNFFTKEGRLKLIPAQYKKKLVALEAMAEQLEEGRIYTEKEINAFIRQYYDDFATIRREFIMHHYMFRENDRYERNPRELWTRWQDVR